MDIAFIAAIVILIAPLIVIAILYVLRRTGRELERRGYMPVEAGDVDDHLLDAPALAAREQRRPRTMQWLFEYFAIVGRSIWWR